MEVCTKRVLSLCLYGSDNWSHSISRFLRPVSQAGAAASVEVDGVAIRDLMPWRIVVRPHSSHCVNGIIVACEQQHANHALGFNEVSKGRQCVASVEL
jgi:hypothetical protein